MNSESSEDQLDRIKSQIREDAAAARQRAPLPERTPTVAACEEETRAAGVSIANLARHAGPVFVDHAYRTILRRPPDPTGLDHQMAVLGSGASKIEVIGDLRYSAEGRRCATRIPGLLPRYVLAKLGRVPLLGALVQWVIAIASLPHMLRHQRATEASLAVRFLEVRQADEQLRESIAAQGESIAAQGESIAARHADLSNALAGLSDRLMQAEASAQALRQHVEGLNATVVDLRQLAFALNHWAAQVRQSIDAIDGAEAERRARADEASAAIILRERGRDAQRKERLQAWTARLAQRLSPTAKILDLCGGWDWLAALTARGWNVSSIEINSTLHREARTRELNVTLGSPATLLARIADESLDALTIASLDRIADEMKTGELLSDAQRILRRRGVLLLDVGGRGLAEQAALADAALGLGFADPETLDLFAGKALMFARA